MKAKVIYLDSVPKGPTAYIIKGFLNYTMIDTDGFGGGGGTHQWILGVSGSLEKALDITEEIYEWFEDYASDFVVEDLSGRALREGGPELDPSSSDNYLYDPEGFNCPLDSQMMDFFSPEGIVDCTMSFKKPWYAIQESEFV